MTKKEFDCATIAWMTWN